MIFQKDFFRAWETRPNDGVHEISLTLTNHNFCLEPFPYKIVREDLQV